MSIDERIERILDHRVPIYRKAIPEKGIEKDCPVSLSIKNAARRDLKIKLANTPSLLEELEKEL